MFKLKNFIFVNVPFNTTEHDIDDTFGNVLQYKINEKWHYDTNLKLPTTNLRVVGVVKNNLVLKFGLNTKFNWIVIKSY